MDEDRRYAWERLTSPPLLLVAVVFLVVYALPILRPDAGPAVIGTCHGVEWIVWAVFVVDVVARLALSHDRWRFLREAWVDVALLLVPTFQPLRALRIIMTLHVLGRRGGSAVLRGRAVGSVVVTVSLIVFVAALAVLDVERSHPQATIRTFGDAIWWAAATVTTVGYGDLTPVTTEGRIVALVLMVTGIGLLGVVTAALASWFLEQVVRVERSTRHTATEVEELAAEVRALRHEVARMRQADAGRVAHRSPRATGRRGLEEAREME